MRHQGQDHPHLQERQAADILELHRHPMDHEVQFMVRIQNQVPEENAHQAILQDLFLRAQLGFDLSSQRLLGTEQRARVCDSE
jgi:hypothetical protein